MRTQLVFSATLFAATLVLGGGNFVYAGALLEPPGDGQIITTATFSSTRRAFDPYGKLVPIPTYEKFELASYIEYGLTDRLALIARPSFSAFPAGSSGSSTNISSDLGLRIGVVDTANIAISVQDEIHAPVQPHDQHQITSDDAAVFSNDLSLLFTHGFAMGGYNAFVDIAAGYRWQSQNLPNEWHADMTLGVRSQPELLWLLQSNAILSTSPASFGSYAMLKFGASAVYDLSRSYSLQLGLFATVAGHNTGRELGPLAGFWYRF